MDPLRQGALQVCNWILEMQRVERWRGRERARSVFFDSMTLSAMEANEPQTASFGRRLSESGVDE
jgi:hypothetical protein